jgi:hypothetical protein
MTWRITPSVNTAQLAMIVLRRPKRADISEIATAARKAPTFCSETMTALTVVLSV